MITITNWVAKGSGRRRGRSRRRGARQQADKNACLQLDSSAAGGGGWSWSWSSGWWTRSWRGGSAARHAGCRTTGSMGIRTSRRSSKVRSRSYLRATEFRFRWGDRVSICMHAGESGIPLHSTPLQSTSLPVRQIAASSIQLQGAGNQMANVGQWLSRLSSAPKRTCQVQPTSGHPRYPTYLGSFGTWVLVLRQIFE